jgi:hypothetical protein
MVYFEFDDSFIVDAEAGVLLPHSRQKNSNPPLF